MKKKLTGTGGPALVSAYNVMTQVCTTGQKGAPAQACIPAHANEADRRCRALTGSTAGSSQQPASAELQFNSLHVNAALYALQEGGCLKPAIACVVMHGRAFGRDVWPVYVKALGPELLPPLCHCRCCSGRSREGGSSCSSSRTQDLRLAMRM